MTSQPSALDRHIIERMQEAVWVVDKRGRTTYVNPRLCALMGCSSEEVVGKDAYKFLDAESRKRVREMDAQKGKKRKLPYEVTVLAKDGTPIPVLVSGSRLPDGGSVGIMMDLRDVKRRDSIYRRLVENMHEAVWMGDKHERTVYANPKFCKLMELTQEEMLGKESYEFWDAESARRVRNVNNSDRKKGIVSSYEGVLVSKSGRRIPVLLNGTPLPDGGTIGIMTDLTDLKKKEKWEHALSRAITYATDAIIICDPKGVVRSWNRGAKLVFGYSEKEMLGKNLSRVFSKDQIAALFHRSQVQFNTELTGKHKSRQSVIVSATISDVTKDPVEDLASFLIIARDITQQRAFEEELSLKYQKMREAYNRFGTLRRQMDYVFELLETASLYSDSQLLGDFIVNATIMLTRVDACVLRRFDEKKQELHLLSSFGVSEDWDGKATIPYAKSLVEKSVEQGSPLKIIDLAAEPRYSSVQLAKKHRFSSMLVIPLQYRGKLMGSLSLYVRPEKRLELFENEFMEQYAKLIALAFSTTSV